MKLEIYRDEKKQWRWRLRAANGELIASGESYKNRSGCEHAIQLVLDAGRVTFDQAVVLVSA